MLSFCAGQQYWTIVPRQPCDQEGEKPNMLVLDPDDNWFWTFKYGFIGTEPHYKLKGTNTKY